MNIATRVSIGLVLALNTSCANSPQLQLNYAVDDYRLTAHSVDRCIQIVTETKLVSEPSFLESINLVSWNIAKAGHHSLAEDLSRLTHLSDLVLLQEAVLTSPAMQGTTNASSASFSPGYARRQFVSGVMTYSSKQPFLECHLANTEPVLRTHKATNITFHAMGNGSVKLLVANVHGINFSLGLREFSNQMQQIERIVNHHDGPVIIAGDFNTWRSGRVRLVNDMVARLNLQPVQFENDYRTVYFGNRVDQIYFRGFTVKSSTTLDLVSSDHNPLVVELVL